jgi:hypothetical protein
LVELSEVFDSFAKHFYSVYNTHCLSKVFPSPLQSSEFLSLATISELEIRKALRRLKTISESFRLDSIPSFIIKGSKIFILVLKHIVTYSGSIHDGTLLHSKKSTHYS